ncbi:hypothetical protein [Oleiharenicola lentus]|uniref:hypothetical protein n=1 Tax=Oleiharenicola lentus TaxID=2508720 RepID=UPI003F6679DA
MKTTSTKLLSTGLLALILALAGRAEGPIKIETLTPAKKQGVTVRSVLVDEVPGVVTEHVEIKGPARFSEPARADENVVWFLLDGRGVVRIQGKDFPFAEETIARAPLGEKCEIEVAAGETVRALRIRKPLNDEDRAEVPKFTQFQKEAYVKTFRECVPYGEAIKSAKTVSRTLLPQDIVPRMAAGTVETVGPDRVLRHKHPMLEQYFVGLRGNDSAVTADEARVDFPEFSVLHIPLGSMHGAEVAIGKKLYYIWLDFFTNKEGQEWLKTHKPITETAKK